MSEDTRCDVWVNGFINYPFVRLLKLLTKSMFAMLISCAPNLSNQAKKSLFFFWGKCFRWWLFVIHKIFILKTRLMTLLAVGITQNYWSCFLKQRDIPIKVSRRLCLSTECIIFSHKIQIYACTHQWSVYTHQFCMNRCFIPMHFIWRTSYGIHEHCALVENQNHREER